MWSVSSRTWLKYSPTARCSSARLATTNPFSTSASTVGRSSTANLVSPPAMRSRRSATSAVASSCASENVFIRNTSLRWGSGTRTLYRDGCIGTSRKRAHQGLLASRVVQSCLKLANRISIRFHADSQQRVCPCPCCTTSTAEFAVFAKGIVRSGRRLAFPAAVPGRLMDWPMSDQPRGAVGIRPTAAGRSAAANFLTGRTDVCRGCSASVAPDLSGELPDFEAIHLELERAQRNPERARGGRDVPARLFERADDEVALEGRDGAFEQVFAGGPLAIELRHVQFVWQILVRDPVLVGDGDQPLDQVFELADVTGPPVAAED